MASKTGPLERAQARFCGGDSVSRCSEIWHPKVHFTLHPEQDIDAPLDSLQVSQRAPARDLAKIPPAWLSRPARGSLFTGPPSTAKVRAQRHVHRACHRKFCAPPRRGLLKKKRFRFRIAASRLISSHAFSSCAKRHSEHAYGRQYLMSRKSAGR